MHDGSLKTLRAVVDYYDKGGTPNKNLDEKIKPLHLTDQDKDDVVEFLKALNGTGWQKIQVPVKFPE
jgi:cytochrome c peroxidase